MYTLQKVFMSVLLLLLLLLLLLCDVFPFEDPLVGRTRQFFRVVYERYTDVSGKRSPIIFGVFYPTITSSSTETLLPTYQTARCHMPYNHST
jgi:hypothetical protein